MRRNAVGFYWTLPVPWAGFTQLSSDIDSAAAQSRTIRYQRDLVRGFAANHGYSLIREEVFLEIDPDRGSTYILPPLEELGAYARANNATLLYADFGSELGWRSHFVMDPWVERQGLDHLPVAPDPIETDGEVFDPADHFRAWRQEQKKWTAGKSERRASALRKIAALLAQGNTHRAIAEELNRRAVPTISGKMWSAEMVRKQVKSP